MKNKLSASQDLDVRGLVFADIAMRKEIEAKYDSGEIDYETWQYKVDEWRMLFNERIDKILGTDE